ncbi:CHRD domain-containing protein [Parasediminibacterium paludis]|uniref:CHRD domain-containing protein n=1 Tax=Parasediminibacterium paludis TaxID=908966 RepID=A0ABV8PR42_9BACT
MKKNVFSLILLCTCCTTIFLSCKKNDAVTAPTIVKQWTVSLSAKNENPAPAGRNETGTASFMLMSDNSLVYTITVNNLASGDMFVAAHLHAGDAITSGPVILPLAPVFSGGVGTGTTTNLRSTLVDSLKNDMNEIYFNAHTSQVGSGLIRGQLNTNIEMAADVALNGANEANPVTTSAIGLATFRLTTSQKLYTKYVITNLESGDTLTAAHIHKGAWGTNGPVILPIYGSNAEFGTVKIIPITDPALFASLKTDAIYANAHSIMHPGGIIRGQIR